MNLGANEGYHVEFGIRKLLSEITLNPAVVFSPLDERLENMGLDSVGMIEFIHALEEWFNIQVPDDEVLPKHFDSIRSLTKFVKSKNAHPIHIFIKELAVEIARAGDRP